MRRVYAVVIALQCTHLPPAHDAMWPCACFRGAGGRLVLTLNQHGSRSGTGTSRRCTTGKASGCGRKQRSYVRRSLRCCFRSPCFVFFCWFLLLLLLLLVLFPFCSFMRDLAGFQCAPQPSVVPAIDARSQHATSHSAPFGRRNSAERSAQVLVAQVGCARRERGVQRCTVRNVT